MSFKSGFVTIIGRPNVGKSTLFNSFLNTKLAIVSPKAQTTRNTIEGIYTTDTEQIIFIDTPGIHKPKHKLGKYMTNAAINTLNWVDLIIFMVNVEESIGSGDKYILNLLQNVEVPVILALNKIDRITKEELVNKINEYKNYYNFLHIVPISALKNKNVNTLLNLIKESLPEGPKYYSGEEITTRPEKFIISEIIREKILQFTQEEVPHSVACIVEKIEEKKTVTKIYATIVVERASQKGIIIGEQGKMLKKIGTHSRRDIEAFLGRKVFLELFVKVEKKWREKEKYLTEFGYKKDE
ncbi:MAG TPA: GTPase Era [Tenericutes bacterium]|jgi:GTP-binding protein Era|nr:GTPase Era [Mycoplasmatota bacterium]